MSGENENMSAGTIKLTNGSTAVVGTSTTFTTDLKSGDVITSTIGGVFYTLFVDTVTSATALTLSDAFTGPTTTGAAYVAVPQMTLNRITASLAAQTAEAVRRVLQENVNWQAFYSGTGDITITLPNGTPTGLPITGPSWAKLQSTIGNPLQLRGQLSTAANLNTMNPGDPANVGAWGKNSTTGATIANGYPEDNARGILEVFPYGQSNGGHRFTVSASGRQYFRTLAGTWNGTDGPWGAWIDVSKTALSSTLVTGSATDLNTYNSASQYGVIRVSSSSGATAALNWPYDGFGGYVEITAGFSGVAQQIAISSNGNMFTRYASSATVWSAWVKQDIQAAPNFYVGNADDLIIDGDYPTSTATTGLPVVSGLTGGLNNCRLVVRSVRASASVWQEWYLNSGNSNYQNRRFSRAKYGTGAWSAWAEDVNTASIGATLGSVLGVGLSSLTALAAFDWQQVDFTTGSTSLVTFSKMTNVPTGLTYSADVAVFIRVVGISGTSVSLELFSDTTVDAPYNIYEVLVRGAKASRTFTVRRVFSSADVVPLASGGTGANTAAGARNNMGLKGAAILDVGTVAGTVAAGNDTRIVNAVQNTGGNVNGSLILNAPGAYWQNTAAARYAVSTMTYLDIFRFSQVDIGGVGTAGVLQFVANPGNYLSFDLSPGNGSHSFRHDGKIVTNAGTVAFQASDGRIKNKKGKPTGSARDRVGALAATATQDYLWLNYQSDINTYRYEQPQRGFIAQDAYAVDPTYASKPQSGADDEMPENGDAIWGVNTNAIVADVVLAFEEQQTDVERLTQTVADQQTQIAQLTSAIEQLSQQIQALSQPAAQS